MLFASILSLIGVYIYYDFFQSIYTADVVLFDSGLRIFDICSEQPVLWKYMKLFSILFCFFTYFQIFYYAFSIPLHFIKKRIHNKPISPVCIRTSPCSVYIGNTINKQKRFLSEKSLYQNILITGTIGTGKTSSAIYPFTKQLLQYQNEENEHLGMLILDVKGNYHTQVLQFATQCGRKDDIVVIEIGGKYKYNPLNKPNLSPMVLANRLKTILELFSPNNGESYWLDKVEQILAECIKLCRIYNHQYVTFEEIHKLVNFPNYYLEKMEVFKNLFRTGKLSHEDCYNLLSGIQFFEKEFFNLDSRTLSILKSEITRITNYFISDYRILKTFNPLPEEENFHGFADSIRDGKIVILNMNIHQYQNLSKIMAAYLKLDFQTEVMSRLSYSSPDCIKPVVFICDEYHEYVTLSDANFFAQSREAKCMNIVATQSYTSLLHTLHDKYATEVILQNLINKLWFRTDDLYTIESAQKQIGQIEKKKLSKTVSENAKETSFNYFTHAFHSKDSSLSESYNAYYQKEYVYDTNFFTRELENFSCLAFLSDGYKICPPEKLLLLPYFKNKEVL